MKQYNKLLLILLAALLSGGWKVTDQYWTKEKHNGFSLIFTPADKNNTAGYQKLIENGIVSVSSCFKSQFKQEFDVYIQPSRHALDSTWRKDWNMPEFRSECWMVASGVASRLDMISPQLWDKESCEHKYSESAHTQQLITHELVHVFHGQLNASPDFSNTEGIDWFVEGLATYVSGQLDSAGISEVKKAINGNRIPESLDSFWTGKLRYSLSGSVVMFIDIKYGREKLTELLPLNKKSDILPALNTTEKELLESWKNYIINI